MENGTKNGTEKRKKKSEKVTTPTRTAVDEPRDVERALILHDSLCKRVNDTLLSREGVKVRKVWAPDFSTMNKELDNITDKKDTIVLQALTREISNKPPEHINKCIDDIVKKALTKAKKIVLPTIVAREDKQGIWKPIDVVNAHIRYMYEGSDRVVVCDNYALDDTKYRWEDHLHLNDNGTSQLACNLKYSIAEALDVQVVKKGRK